MFKIQSISTKKNNISRNPHPLILLMNSLFKKINTITICLLLATFFGNVKAQDLDVKIANEYFLNGKKDLAFELYQKLAKKNENIYSIYSNYLSLLLEKELYSEAEKFVERTLKKFPDDNATYSVDLGVVYKKSGDSAKADKYFKQLITSSLSNVGKIKAISNYLASKQLADYSVFALQQLRLKLKNPQLFTLEMASLYRSLGKSDEMINEYLNYVSSQTNSLAYLQIFITTPEEFASLEKQLYIKIQKFPDSPQYPEVLIWLYLDQKKFYNALVQSRAYDKRFQPKNLKTLEVAQISLDNNDYITAIKAYEFVIKEFKETDNYSTARFLLIKAEEKRTKKTLPVSVDSIRLLTYDYQAFINDYPQTYNSQEAQLSEALLHAYFLNEKDSAIQKLKLLLASPRIQPSIRAQTKLDLGDIYVINEEPWESTLLYSQVEKEFKDTPLGYEAKLRNAKFSFYKGDYSLAQEHLDILKQATTQDIANDAMELSTLIKENTTFDTLGLSLMQFSKIQLLLLQNKYAEALDHLQKFKQGIFWMKSEEAQKLGLLKNNNYVAENGTEYLWVTMPDGKMTYEISDDVYWLESSIRMKLGEFETVISLCQNIVKNYQESVLADDAMYRIGQIYDLELNDKEKAKQVYREFLDLFPGSVYASEARKRYRLLRGDFIEELKN